MKILFFIHSLSSGGAERVVTHMANYWSQQGWDVSIITVTAIGSDFYSLDPKIRRIGLNLACESRGLFNGLINNIKRIYALRKILKQEKPQVVLSFMTMANIILAISSIFLNEIITIGSERIYPPKFYIGTMWSYFRKVTYGFLDVIVALTSENACWLKSNTSAIRVEIIPNFSVWPLPDTGKKLMPDSFGRKNVNKILAVGRLDKQKGFDLLIKAYAMLADDFANWDLIIVGEGHLHNELEEQIITNKLSDRIVLVGKVENLSDWYQNMNLFVMSSRFEGFPNTLVEAMSYGLPVVCYDCETGPRDIIHHGEDGLLVADGSVEELASSLRLLMNDSELCKKLSNNAIKVRKRFSYPIIMSEWESLIENLQRGKSSDI